MNLDERIKKWHGRCARKIRYPSYAFAKKVADKRGMPTVYHCTECNGHHMSHKKLDTVGSL